MKIFLFTFIFIVHLAGGQNGCLPATCGPSGPIIRFPFWLKDHQPEHCGYPGFELTCTESGDLKFDLQFPVTASANNIVLPLLTTVTVGVIDYGAQQMLVRNAVARSCPPEKLTTLNSLASPFEVEALGYSEGFVLFNCSNAESDWRTVSCLSNHDHKVITVASTDEITALPPHSSCFKMYNISYVPYNALTGRDDEYGERFYIRWRKPSCGNCEADGMFCRLRNNETAEDTECFSPEQPRHGITVGTILLGFIMVELFFIFISMRRKKEEHKRIQQILENHKDMRPRRYSYADIKRITDNFKEKLGQQTLFKGMLVDETRVAVKMLDHSEQNVEDFIDDGHNRSDGTQSQTHMLGWETLHRVALGVAKGIDYVRQVCNQNILSLDINPQNILLDDNFNPKVLKADVYSFGMLLLDVVGRRSGREKENGGIYFPEWILKNEAERAIQIDKEEENEIVKKLLVFGLWCIQWFPSDRPSMETVIQMLEGDNKPIMPPNPFASFNLIHT
ncbi:LEAF RUST 10 DISEASE-RESISTANCE LOCUS RECEPTOR-LIKE PROTEIN KINASE-like 2.4 [Sesamum angolense]|uniref:LEAF RUST 10 DISEASE-RESISTANCE LOCUS RECEPTOR-LIKE PROTEIN KINASE-like 2.4 n=1 Tax=Sesamum angolense TaxID=2727404 RepID=A0AAE1X2V0_9LAMI|nr:LEAF RUST 10 DISEASE-RESISTANCE LOCUS RECEPTOR-LIKE PROTEIN KINASE-like 2.4 [Sesamum angolense]